ncbi:zinc-binding alcohol dehydrogenase family protein [Companilactobacillus sp. DQM5]|uniref:zinc-binding alcohol dehydrogenase family protein n=1 Tax=Companilactobacillus sp. DQM5 TaxID=3463359 RepID=UPI004059FBD9
MKAFGFKKYYPISDERSFIEFEAPTPKLRDEDVLVEVLGIALNPVDIATRKQVTKELIEPMIVGYDGYGKIVDKANSKFENGDLVFFAGDHTRFGSYAELIAVDQRTIALAPNKISLEEAVAMPLTSLTAYESLVDKLNIDFSDNNQNKSILIINGSGGVGSVATQLAKIAGLKVIATASPNNQEWVKNLGADIVIDHHENIVEQLKKQDIEEIDYILVYSAVDPHWKEITSLIKPFGKIVTITSTTSNMNDLKSKSVSFEWEYMFTKTIYQTESIDTQGQYLAKIAKWLNEGKLKSTVKKVYNGLNLRNIKDATKLLEDGHMVGKIVIKK